MQKNTLFSRILFYTSIESILYQGLLCSHQVLLFRTADAILYGQAGALFSGIFLLALYLNAGLDISLASLFIKATQNKNNFIHLFFKQFLGLFSIPVFLAAAYFIFPTYIQNITTPGIFIISACLVFIESAKKTIRTMLHLALSQKTVALVEITSLSFYIISVWSCILLGKILNLYIIFIPMLITSLVSLSIYSWYLYIFYAKLPNICEPSQASICWKSIGQMRIKNWSYQILHSLYSNNFMILSIAQLYGFELAALLKVMSFCVYSINYAVQHVFGVASSVLFAYTKTATELEKQQAFSRIRTRLFYVLLICPITLIAYHWYLYALHPNLCVEQMHIISLFMVLLFSENITVAHEHYFIIEGRTNFLIVCNAILLIPCIIVQRNLCMDSPTTLLYILLIMRASNFLLLHYADQLLPWCENMLQQKYKLLFAGK